MKINLPIMHRQDFDHSMLETHDECPRKFAYKYVYNRATSGVSYPIVNGNIYHYMMEGLNKHLVDNHGKVPDDETAQKIMAKGIEKYWPGDPSPGHYYEWMTLVRVVKTLEAGFQFFKREQLVSRREVIRAEEPFLLYLPNKRTYGGRIDNILLWNRKLWMKDYKTTSKMGKTYPDKFDPANQFTGYIWASGELTGRRPAGAIIQSIYNTKNQGPQIVEHITQRSEGQINRFLESTMQKIEDIDRHYDKNTWPMNTNACQNWGGCPYRQACKKDSDEEIEEWLTNNTQFIVWDFTNPDADDSVD